MGMRTRKGTPSLGRNGNESVTEGKWPKKKTTSDLRYSRVWYKERVKKGKDERWKLYGPRKRFNTPKPKTTAAKDK
jgi:hypothetical protein